MKDLKRKLEQLNGARNMGMSWHIGMMK
ncbi:hypothetical protein V6N11_079174 [Hibiscus sabdariffa]|uniref:Uncharacterized protein n=1 Tax=Hibiscus sabdariffa TaxID=183260 RepID=A0ABR2RUZ9_9ROSI